MRGAESVRPSRFAVRRDTAGQERYHSLAPMYYRGARRGCAPRVAPTRAPRGGGGPSDQCGLGAVPLERLPLRAPRRLAAPQARRRPSSCTTSRTATRSRAPRAGCARAPAAASHSRCSDARRALARTAPRRCASCSGRATRPSSWRWRGTRLTSRRSGKWRSRCDSAAAACCRAFAAWNRRRLGAQQHEARSTPTRVRAPSGAGGTSLRGGERAVLHGDFCQDSLQRERRARTNGAPLLRPLHPASRRVAHGAQLSPQRRPAASAAGVGTAAERRTAPAPARRRDVLRDRAQAPEVVARHRARRRHRAERQGARTALAACDGAQHAQCHQPPTPARARRCRRHR